MVSAVDWRTKAARKAPGGLCSFMGSMFSCSLYDRYLRYLSIQSAISVRRVILFFGLPPLDRPWLSPWKRTKRVGTTIWI